MAKANKGKSSKSIKEKISPKVPGKGKLGNKSEGAKKAGGGTIDGGPRKKKK